MNITPTDEAFLAALAEVMKVEYEKITDAGYDLCKWIVQTWPWAGTSVSATPILQPFKKAAQAQVEALNYALENVSGRARVRMHLCWGNYEGPHHHDVDLREIIDIVFSAKPQAIQFEGANPAPSARMGDHGPRRDIPDDKILIPGTLDTTTNFVEHPELVAQRIERFSNIVGKERVIAGTDCGFGTFAGFGAVHPDIAYAKLRSLAEGARIASERLWR